MPIPLIKDVRLVPINTLVGVGGAEPSTLSGEVKIVGQLNATVMTTQAPNIMDAWSFNFMLQNYPTTDRDNWPLTVSDKDAIMLWQRNIKLNFYGLIGYGSGLNLISFPNFQDYVVFALSPAIQEDLYLVVVSF